MHQLFERLGYFQRDNQQGHRESEHRIAEAFNARYFVTAPTELHAIADAPVDKFFSNHIGVARGYYRLVPVATASLRWTLQLRLNKPLQFRRACFAETDKMAYEFSLTINEERLRNVSIVTQQLLNQ